MLELIDLAGTARAYRVAEVEPDYARAMVRTLTRGTCDINRAQAEVQNLESQSTLLGVTISMNGDEVTGSRRLGTGEIPREHWRSLPCDGTWVTRE